MQRDGHRQRPGRRDRRARCATRRSGTLTFTIGTGCCESTAPFLYEDFWPGPDQEPVGEVGGVVVFAPEYLRRLYPGDEGAVLEVVDEMAESLSIETELGVRLVLRGTGLDSTTEPEVCEVPEPRQPGGRSERADPVDAADRGADGRRVAAPRAGPACACADLARRGRRVPLPLIGTPWWPTIDPWPSPAPTAPVAARRGPSEPARSVAALARGRGPGGLQPRPDGRRPPAGARGPRSPAFSTSAWPATRGIAVGARGGRLPGVVAGPLVRVGRLLGLRRRPPHRAARGRATRRSPASRACSATCTACASRSSGSTPSTCTAASDARSMAANNTSAFNCRYVSGTTRWSEHAYGLAIDINPIQNPYVKGSTVDPPAGGDWTDRDPQGARDDRARRPRLERLRLHRLGVGRRLDHRQGLPALQPVRPLTSAPNLVRNMPWQVTFRSRSRARHREGWWARGGEVPGVAR